MSPFAFVVARKIYKPYIIIPLFLYVCLMYRILDGTCDRATRKDTRINNDNRNSISVERNSKENSNFTSSFLKLAQEYRTVERHRRYILDALREVVDHEEVSRSKDIPLPVFHQLNSIHDSNDYQGNYHREDQTNQDIQAPRYTISCQNIHEIQLKRKIGHGYSKQTFSADFRGHPVAVKMVSRHQMEVKSCIDKLNKSFPDIVAQRNRCFSFSNMKLMKEILLLQQLHHPGFASLLGYCIRNEESDTTDLSERGIVSVFELGTRITSYNLQTLPWPEKLKHALELAEFLYYLEFSPLGSLRIRDFKEEHFLMINGSLKMIDLDDVDNLEPSCSVYVSIDAQEEMALEGKDNGCGFNLPCQKGLCVGFNAKQNMMYMNKLFFKHLLFPLVFPREAATDLGNILADLDSGHLTAEMLIHRLETINNVSLYLRDIL